MSDAPDYVIATYREIADRFQLGDPRAARTKAKRAGWVHESVNHPADPRRVRVPRARWDDAGVNPRAQQSEPQGPGVQTEDEPPGTPAQTIDEHGGSVSGEHEVTSGEHGGSYPKTAYEPPGVKIHREREHRGLKRRTPRDQERDAQRIKDLEAMIGVYQEQLARERGRADASDALVRELTAKLVALAERPSLTDTMMRALISGRVKLAGLLSWRPRPPLQLPAKATGETES